MTVTMVTDRLPCKHCSKHLMCNIHLVLTVTTLWRRSYYHPHVISEEMGGKKSPSVSWLVAGLPFKFKPLVSRAQVHDLCAIRSHSCKSRGRCFIPCSVTTSHMTLGKLPNIPGLYFLICIIQQLHQIFKITPAILFLLLPDKNDTTIAWRNTRLLCSDEKTDAKTCGCVCRQTRQLPSGTDSQDSARTPVKGNLRTQ